MNQQRKPHWAMTVFDAPWKSPIRLTEVEYAVLRHIRGNPARSRTEIAADLGISKGMMTKAMNHFDELGLVIEDQAERGERRGKPPVRVMLRHQAYCAIGISLSVHHLAIVTADFGGTVINEIVRPLQGDPSQLLGQHLEDVAAALAAAPYPVLGIGMALHARVNEAGELFEVTPSQSALPLTDFAAGLRERFALPVFWDNGAYCLASYEAHRPRNAARFLFFAGFEYGVGAGFVAKGELFRGAHNQALNFGALVPEPGPRPNLPDLADHLGRRMEDLTLEVLDDLIAAKDRALFEWIEDRSKRLSVPLSSVVQLYNPDQVILGGLFPVAMLDLMVARIDLTALDVPGRRPMTMPTFRASTLVGARGRAEAASLLPFSARLLGEKTIAAKTA
jgi:predicted NBD/HSP70 family sugar kinase/biotin operon repressor